MFELLGWVVGSMLYCHVAEYAIHRFVMHGAVFGRGWYYLDHAIEHHAKSRNDINIPVTWPMAMFVSLPLFAGCIWLGFWWAVFVSAVALVYARTWTALHHAHHDLGYEWVARIPGYGYWRTQHLRHHYQPKTNYGAVFPWTDAVFRTRFKT